MAGTKSVDPVDRMVGSRVRMRRMELRMSQEKLGDALGVTFQQVQKYEKGTNRIGASRLNMIARSLQVPIEYFYEGLEKGSAATAKSEVFVSEFLKSREGVELMRAFSKIKNPRLRKTVLTLARDLAHVDTGHG